jgi:hypothetical protein
LSQVLDELAHLGLVARQHELTMAPQRARDRGRADIWISVHVATHPRGNAQETGGDVHAVVGTVDAYDGVGEVLVEGGYDSIDDVGDVKEHMLDFVGDGRLHRQMLFGLPRGRHLVPNSCGCGRFFAGQQIGVEALDQRACNSLLLDEEDPPRRLGWVGGEHRLDQHGIEHFLQIVGRHTSRLEMLQYGQEATRLGAAAWPQVVASAANAVHSLRHVHQAKIGGKRPDDVLGHGGAESVEHSAELGLGVGVANAPRLRPQSR